MSDSPAGPDHSPAATGRELVRLQCYEGLDESKALYEWEYAKQLLYTHMVKEKIHDVIAGAGTLSDAVEKIASQEDAFFSERFIQPRPLLQAITSSKRVVLLIDEVDKSDPEFEAFLLELLSDFQVSIPEIGTKKALMIPFVVLTSNNYRDMSDALKRRCIHIYIDYPERDLELRIVGEPRRRIEQSLRGFLPVIRGVFTRQAVVLSQERHHRPPRPRSAPVGRTASARPPNPQSPKAIREARDPRSRAHPRR